MDDNQVKEEFIENARDYINKKKKYGTSAHISIAKLCRMADVSRTTAEEILDVRRPKTASALYRIFKVLDADVSEYLRILHGDEGVQEVSKAEQDYDKVTAETPQEDMFDL